MVKRLLLLALIMLMIAGCSALRREPSAGGFPRTTTVKGTYAGVTDRGWVRIELPDGNQTLELELQKEVKPAFETMQLQAGEEVWVSYYQEVPKIAGISRTHWQHLCGTEVNRHGQGIDPRARECLWQRYIADVPGEFTTTAYTTEGDPITYQVRVNARTDIRVLVDSQDHFGTMGQFGYACRRMEREGQGFALTDCRGPAPGKEVHVP